MSFCLSKDVSVGLRDELISDVGCFTCDGLVGGIRDLDDDVDLHSHLCRLRLDETAGADEEVAGSILHCTQA